MAETNHEQAFLLMLERLAQNPPQSLLLEGGSEESRLNAALHWARSLNCPQAMSARARSQPAHPCGSCPVCKQIASYEFLDLLVYDGRISNKQDEENPEPIRAMNVDNMRLLKSVNGAAPHGEGKRVAIFQGLSLTREEALNSILKTLEEPSPYTVFVLLTPQRQQLLPTLVSRSLCLTLPWQGCRDSHPELARWEDSLAEFFAQGSGFMDAISAKGAVDAALASQIVLTCQRSVARILAQDSSVALDRALAPLAPNAVLALRLNAWANEAQTMLLANVTPARVLEAFSARIFLLLRQKG